jgi:hypothetical protein
MVAGMVAYEVTYRMTVPDQWDREEFGTATVRTMADILATELTEDGVWRTLDCYATVPAVEWIGTVEVSA